MLKFRRRAGDGMPGFEIYAEDALSTFLLTVYQCLVSRDDVTDKEAHALHECHKTLVQWQKKHKIQRPGWETMQFLARVLAMAMENIDVERAINLAPDAAAMLYNVLRVAMRDMENAFVCADYKPLFVLVKGDSLQDLSELSQIIRAAMENDDDGKRH